MKNLILLALITALMMGCSVVDPAEVGDPSEETTDKSKRGTAPIQTDKQSYTLDATATHLTLTVAVTYTNDTDQTVYLTKCGFESPAPVLEKRVGDEWVPALASVCPAVLVDPVEVAPGQTYEQTVILRSYREPNTYPRFSIDDVPGTYRLHYDILGTWDPDDGPGLGEPLPLEDRVSNTFTIEG